MNKTTEEKKTWIQEHMILFITLCIVSLAILSIISFFTIKSIQKQLAWKKLGQKYGDKSWLLTGKHIYV